MTVHQLRDQAEEKMTRFDEGRRRFLVAGLTATGGFLLGVPSLELLADDQVTPTGGKIGFFVEIRPDNKVVIGAAQPEIGQGVRTSMPMLVAEELDVEWSSVSVEQMPLGIAKTEEGYTWKYGGQGAGGSNSVVGNWEFLRQVGATARGQLVAAASERWGVNADSCRTESGVVVCDALGKRAKYSELAEAAARLPIPETKPALKKASDYRIIGTPTPVVDAREIVTGTAGFGIDAELPGMQYAVIERCPYLDGKVASFDDSEVRKVPGVVDVFAIQGPSLGEPFLILASGVCCLEPATPAPFASDDISG